MATIRGANEQGDDVYIDIKYKCKYCGELYEEEDEAEECFKLCIEEDYGCGIEEVQIEKEHDDYLDQEE